MQTFVGPSSAWFVEIFLLFVEFFGSFDTVSLQGCTKIIDSIN